MLRTHLILKKQKKEEVLKNTSNRKNNNSIESVKLLICNIEQYAS